MTAGFLLAAVALLHGAGLVMAWSAGRRAATAQGAVAWAIALVLVPVAALPAYAVFGPARRERIARGRDAARAAALAFAGTARPAARDPTGTADPRAALERLAPLPAAPAPPPDLLVDGAATFDAVFAAIDAARDRLFLQFYIVRDDGLGRRLKERLCARARAGVSVFFLYDRLGSRRLPRRYARELAAAGVDVRPFGTPGPLGRLLRLNHRNHRKVVVADGRVAILGGPNVGDEYLGRDPRYGDWRDTAVSLSGPAARAVEAAFLEDWVWSGGPLPARPAPEPPASAGSAVGRLAPTLVLPTGPADETPACTLAMCHLIGLARERLWIASPYFVPDLDVQTALKLAALRGVDVRILVPDRPDHTIVWLAGFVYAEDASRAGIAIHRFRAGFMHQKVLLVDEAIAAIGTVNLDARSLRQNFELTAVTFDRDFAAEVAAMLERDFAAAPRDDRPLSARPPGVRLLAPVARLAAPLL